MDLKYILTTIDSFLYSNILTWLLIFAGLYFSIKTKFVQIRLLPKAIKAVAEKSDGKNISSFQALMISTASRVGVGNIAGVALAITTGGPGAVFWMWIMAIIGAASSFVESTLAQIYKIKDRNGGFIGGPSYYMEKALKKRWLGIIFAICLIMCFAYSFNALQAYTISSSMDYYIPGDKKFVASIILAIILTALVAFIIFGGIHRIGFVTSYIVPIMAIIYILIGIYISIKNYYKIPEVLALIFKSAFDFKAILGGFSGSALLIGIQRGLFSNEAGMGSAPNAAATATASHPVQQGLVQVLSVFIDTIIICTTSAFLVLLSGVMDCGLTEMPLVQAAVENQIGNIGIHFITVSVFAFAFTSMVGNYCYAESSIKFIKDDKTFLNIFRVTCLLAVFFGTLATLDTVYKCADIFMACMALINIVVILLLGKTTFKTLDDYVSQKKKGIEPVFNPKKLGIENTESWD